MREAPASPTPGVAPVQVMRANVTSKQFLVHMAPCDVVLLKDVLQHWEDHLVVKVLDILQEATERGRHKVVLLVRTLPA